MALSAGAVWKALFVLGIIAYQVLVHLALTMSNAGPVRIASLVLPMVALGGWILLRSSHRLLWLLILTSAASATFLLAHGEGLGFAAVYGVPHAAAYLFMLWLFGRTLVHGEEPLITRLSRQVRGALPAYMEAYTRRLTWAWCVFFAAQLAASALLLKFGSVETWSLFINVLNFPLVGLMFLGDYLYRVVRYREFPQSSIAEAVQAYAKDRLSSPRAR
ncbi:MAG TPA: hypothetical protein VN929_03370 [Burkholderiales bacterium]|nr:hypothetical protein [Burkholderiales bacterium]